MLTASHKGEHFLRCATEDFTQGRKAKLHTQESWKFQKTRLQHKTTHGSQRISPGSKD